MVNLYNPHSINLIIEDSATSDLITTCAFVVLDNDPKSTNRQAAFTVVEVDPDIIGFTSFKVWELIALPIDNKLVNEYILAVNEQKQIHRLHIDLENYHWFNGKNEWKESTRYYLAKKELEKKKAQAEGKKKPFFIPTIPSLRVLGELLGQPERGKDPTLRQLSTLQGAFDRGEIILNEHIKQNPNLMAQLSRVGQNIFCDVLAGAMYKAKDLQKNLRAKFNYQDVITDLDTII